MSNTKKSRRAVFLEEMLTAFESEDAIRMGNVVNDWQANTWRTLWWLDGNEDLAEGDWLALGEMARGLKRLVGHGIAEQKTTAAPPWQREEIEHLWRESLSKLTANAQQRFGSVLELVDLGELESLDAQYAHEILRVLHQIINRLGSLDRIAPLSVPNRSVQLAFEEAHRCFLYGFSRACVVMCRSTVEYALRECLVAFGESQLADETKLSSMLKSPKAITLLGNQYRNADEVRLAGNRAVHRNEAFEQEYPASRIQEVVLATRKIIEHLYGLPNR